MISVNEMSEAQVTMRLSGSLRKPSCLVSARAGRAGLQQREGDLRQYARSTRVPPNLQEAAEHLRRDALNKLMPFVDLEPTLSMQGLVRERDISRIPNYHQAYAGFWGSLNIDQQWTSVFGSDPDGQLTFRRGPWEDWDPNLPIFDVVDEKRPLIFSPYCATLFHEAVGHALEDDYLAGSPLKFYHGEKVSHDQLTVMDRPDLPGYAGSMSHDDVGMPTSATTLIHRGFLVGELAAGRAPLRRASYREAPLVRATNFVIAAGDAEPESWYRQLPHCFYVTWVQSGNWRPGSEMFKVLTGPIVELVHGRPVAKRPWATLRFSIGKFLRAISGVGRDLTMDPVVHWCVKQNQRVPMSMGSPSLLLERWS